MEPSRPVSVPVNLVSSHVQKATLSVSAVVFWLSALSFPVITGTVTALGNGPRGTLYVSVSIIKAYKTGRLTITQVGETMSTRLVSQCRKCPLFRRGTPCLDIHSHTWHVDFKILINHYGLVLFRDRGRLHYHGSGGWRRTWYPGAWCIHSPIQTPTSQTVNEHQ